MNISIRFLVLKPSSSFVSKQRNEEIVIIQMCITTDKHSNSISLETTGPCYGNRNPKGFLNRIRQMPWMDDFLDLPSPACDVDT